MNVLFLCTGNSCRSQMAEAGVDITGQQNKTLEDLGDLAFDHVITPCGDAHETCLVFPGATRVVRRGFDDPPALARQARSESEALGHYRRVRDEIRASVERLPCPVGGEDAPSAEG